MWLGLDCGCGYGYEYGYGCCDQEDLGAPKLSLDLLMVMANLMVGQMPFLRLSLQYLVGMKKRFQNVKPGQSEK